MYVCMYVCIYIYIYNPRPQPKKFSKPIDAQTNNMFYSHRENSGPPDSTFSQGPRPSEVKNNIYLYIYTYH